jgi:hypothetical protein
MQYDPMKPEPPVMSTVSLVAIVVRDFLLTDDGRYW